MTAACPWTAAKAQVSPDLAGIVLDEQTAKAGLGDAEGRFPSRPHLEAAIARGTVTAELARDAA